MYKESSLLERENPKIPKFGGNLEQSLYENLDFGEQ